MADVDLFGVERPMDQLTCRVLADCADIRRLATEPANMHGDVQAIATWIHLVARDIAINHVVTHGGDLDHLGAFGLLEYENVRTWRSDLSNECDRTGRRRGP